MKAQKVISSALQAILLSQLSILQFDWGNRDGDSMQGVIFVDSQCMKLRWPQLISSAALHGLTRGTISVISARESIRKERTRGQKASTNKNDSTLIENFRLNKIGVFRETTPTTAGAYHKSPLEFPNSWNMSPSSTHLGRWIFQGLGQSKRGFLENLRLNGILRISCFLAL